MVQLALMMGIGGLIGFLTNKVAVKMLFRPIKPRGFLWFKIQGVLPKRKHLIAESMGKTIEEAFISKEDIFDTLITEETKDVFKAVLKQELTEKIDTIVPPMFKRMLGVDVSGIVETFVDAEADKLIDKLLNSIKEEGIAQLDISRLVKERVDALDFIEFEALVMTIVKRELRHIEMVGLFLGLVIGFMQFIIITFVA